MSCITLYWKHLSLFSIDVKFLYEIIHIWTAVVDESEEWSSQLIFQFEQLEEEAWKNQGFNGIGTRDLRDTGVMLYQLSYEATHWEWGQFIEFISSREEWNDVKFLYEIIHIWTAVVDESEEWSSQLIFLAPNVWLHSSVGRALHRYRGGHRFESRWSPDFFRLLPIAQIGKLTAMIILHFHLFSIVTLKGNS